MNHLRPTYRLGAHQVRMLRAVADADEPGFRLGATASYGAAGSNYTYSRALDLLEALTRKGLIKRIVVTSPLPREIYKLTAKGRLAVAEHDVIKAHDDLDAAYRRLAEAAGSQ